MKQIVQDLKTGKTIVEDVPAPLVRPGHLLIRSVASLVSAGTERMLLDFGKASLIEKARQQPDKVRMAVDKARTDGIGPTLRSIQDKLNQPVALGYSNVGIVVEVGPGVARFEQGDRIVSNGPHAAVVCVPTNLCATIPDEVNDESASFTILGSVALQSIRLMQPTIGENIVVIGLGLVGLLTVQLLHANGCNVLGIDPDLDRCRLAAAFGASTCCLSTAEDPLSAASSLSAGRGVDGVIIAASTQSNEPVRQAAHMCRTRGKIVLVGVAGLELARADFYEKELSFQVSCSYGPGRYDVTYEQEGQDYPFGFVRWTEQRNFEAFLTLLRNGAVNVESLITHRFSIEDAGAAYEALDAGRPLGVVLQYSGSLTEPLARSIPISPSRSSAAKTSPVVAVIGAGNYSRRVLIPAFRATSARLTTLVSEGGTSSVHVGRKHGFESAATDPEVVLGDASVNAVAIATRHDSHSDLVCRALRRGKNVFVEKPLTVTREQLDDVIAAYKQSRAGEYGPIVMIGFNRRFAPQILKLRELLSAAGGPKSFVMTINSGEIPVNHWVQDPDQGGRIIGEACHFIDLLRFLADSPIVGVHAVMMGRAPSLAIREDKASITLEFEDGSFGTVHYLANGHRSFPKERLEVFCQGAIIALDNFRRMNGYGWPGFRKMNLRRQDKGNVATVATFVNAINDGLSSPIPFDEIVEVSRATFDAVDHMHGL